MAETMASMMVKIGADVSGIEQSTKKINQDFKTLGTNISGVAKEMGQSARGFGDQWKLMSQEMQTAYQLSAKKLEPLKKQQKEVEYGFFKMAQGMSDYKGTTNEFMNDLNNLGKQHKKIADDIIKNSDFMKQGFIQSIATMQARSTQFEKIAQNFDKMNNPLYKVNNGLLKVTQGLEGIAKKGQPAYLALKMLGPTANMKALNDQMMLINQGLMRFTMVSLAAVVGAGLFYGALHGAAASMPGYTESFETMTATMKQAFQPMIEVFASIMIKVYEFITLIGQMIVKFNEANPVLAKVLQGFLMLIPALMLLLSPLAIGIGMINGTVAAFTSLWVLIAPLVTGLGAMMGTVLLVAGAIAVVGVAIWALWTKTDWFKDAVLTAWEAIKTATKTAWDFIYNSILMPIWNGIVTLGQQILSQLQSFWGNNGKNITKITQTVYAFISTYIKTQLIVIKNIFELVFPVIRNIVEVAFKFIKTAIRTTIDIITGIIGAFAALLTGDWDALWDNIVKIGKAAWELLKSVITLGVDLVIGIVEGLGEGLLNIFGDIGQTFYNAGKGFMEMLIKGIKSMIGKVTSVVSDVAGQIRDYLPFSPAKTGPLSDLDKLDFGNPIADSITKGVPMIKNMLSDMLTLPSIDGKTIEFSNDQNNNNNSNSSKETVIHTHVYLDSREIGYSIEPVISDIQGFKTNLKMRMLGV